jgi:hypothetical protein
MARLATREATAIAWQQLAISWANLVLGERRLIAVRAELLRLKQFG